MNFYLRAYLKGYFDLSTIIKLSLLASVAILVLNLNIFYAPTFLRNDRYWHQMNILEHYKSSVNAKSWNKTN
jgi:hypothetical protein